MTLHAHNRRVSSCTRSLYLALGCFVLWAPICRADSVNNITLPSAIGFTVTDVLQSTTGNPDRAAVSFTDYIPGTGSTLHIGIQANASEFVRPDGAGGSIPASSVTWTAGAPASGHSTFNGALDALLSTDVYRGNAPANSFNMTWTLAPLNPTVRAGTHALSATWKVESL